MQPVEPPSDRPRWKRKFNMKIFSSSSKLFRSSATASYLSKVYCLFPHNSKDEHAQL